MDSDGRKLPNPRFIKCSREIRSVMGDPICVWGQDGKDQTGRMGVSDGGQTFRSGSMDPCRER